MAKKAKETSFNFADFCKTIQPHEPVGTKVYYLIVSEGEKTEPNYFKSFQSQRNGGIINVIETDGGEINTVDVVKLAIEKRDERKQDPSKTPYDAVWAVFDKDSFPDVRFNEAIELANREKIGCAWSNEAFELWYLLHFLNRTTCMSRQEYQDAIEAEMRKRDKKANANYKYRKNDESMLVRLNLYGNESNACKFAKDMEAKQNEEYPGQYSKQNPCTTVYKLVDQLRGRDPKFNQVIKDKMGK